MLSTDLLDRILADLQALREQAQGVGDLGKALARGKADLDSMNDACARANGQMKEAQGLLTQAQAAAQRQFDLEMNNKQGQLKGLTERVQELVKQEAELTERLHAKNMQLQAVNSSLTDVRQRLAG